MRAARGRLRRIGYRAGIVLSVALIVAGAVVGYVGYERTGGPDGAVRDYFAALVAGDAPRALSWGDVPAGPHTLLTSDVLGLQQRIAPMRKVSVGDVVRTGSRAVVTVSYELAFADVDLPVRTDVAVVERDGDWRLRSVAVSTQLLFDSAGKRMSVLGSAVPRATTLLFPGALPIQFDTPLLELRPADSVVGFDAGPVLDVGVQISTAGRSAVRKAVSSRLASCLSGTSDVTCPVPDDRYVPGSLRGKLVDNSVETLALSLGGSADGTVVIDGTATMSGSWRELTFANIARRGSGQVALNVRGHAYATTPITIVWDSP